MNGLIHVLRFSFAATLVAASDGPCDIYSISGTPCVAAHSMVRALYGSYKGPLYQVRRSSDNATLDVGLVEPGAVADVTDQDRFCSAGDCVVQRIYDQSPRANHLDPAPGGPFYARAPCRGVNASRSRVVIGGRPAYAAHFEKGMGYRNDRTSGVAKGTGPETMYMVVAGGHHNDGCCFDYGNAETDVRDDGVGTMEAVYWGSSRNYLSHPGTGKGPWIMADLENGLWAGNKLWGNTQTPLFANFVTAMLKGDSADRWTLKGGDAQAGRLQTLFDGTRPWRYFPMKKQGAIILGIGGDNSHAAVGTFYEGVMTAGYSSDNADAAVQANIVAAGYGRDALISV